MSSQAVQGQWWSHTMDSLAGQDVGSCSRWWYKRLCSGLQRFDACVDRERSLDRPLVARGKPRDLEFKICEERLLWRWV